VVGRTVQRSKTHPPIELPAFSPENVTRTKAMSFLELQNAIKDAMLRQTRTIAQIRLSIEAVTGWQPASFTRLKDQSFICSPGCLSSWHRRTWRGEEPARTVIDAVKQLPSTLEKLLKPIRTISALFEPISYTPARSRFSHLLCVLKLILSLMGGGGLCMVPRQALVRIPGRCSNSPAKEPERLEYKATLTTQASLCSCCSTYHDTSSNC